MELDSNKVRIAIAESRLQVCEILEKAGISQKTWLRAYRGKSIRPVTAGKIAYALSVPVQSLLP